MKDFLFGNGNSSFVFSVLKALTAAAVLTAMSCGGVIAVENIKVTPTALSLGIGETAVLKAEVEPADASVNVVLWSVTQGTAVTVDGYGKVTAMAAGTATVTAETVDGGKKASCTVTVGNGGGSGGTGETGGTGGTGGAAVESVTLDRSSVTLGVGNSVTLQATVKPATATAAVVWSLVSGDGILTIDQKGRITAKATGTATVAVEAGGETATCLVTVIREGVIADLAFIDAVERDMQSTWGSSDGWDKEIDGTVRMNWQNMKIIKEVTELYLNNENLSSLDGIEYFTGLEYLTCSNNRLTALDVGNLHNLKKLYCYNNQIETGKLILPPQLTYLSCSDNRLEQLDETVLPAGLTELYCQNNPLTKLEVGTLTKLTKLGCAGGQLTRLSVNGLTELTYLSCGFNNLSHLDIAMGGEEINSNLEELHCQYNNLGYINVYEIKTLKALICDNNKISSLKLPYSTSTEQSPLFYLTCSGNNISRLDVSNYIKLTSLDCEKNEITELNITKLNGLTSTSFFRCGGQRNENNQIVLHLTSTQNTTWTKNWKKYNNGVETRIANP